jgi:hypothetical protein
MRRYREESRVALSAYLTPASSIAPEWRSTNDWLVAAAK